MFQFLLGTQVYVSFGNDTNRGIFPIMFELAAHLTGGPLTAEVVEYADENYTQDGDNSNQWPQDQ